MGKRNKKNRSMVNVFSDDEDIPSNNHSNNNTDKVNESDIVEEKKKNYNPFQLLNSDSEKDENLEEFIQVKKKEKPLKQYKVETKVEPIKTETKVEPIKTETKVEPIKTETKVEPIKTETKVEPIKTETNVLKNSLYNKANQSAKFKNYDLAIKFYKESTEKEKNPKSAYNLALLYEDFDNNDDAITYYKIACEMNHHNAYCNLAILLMEEEKYTESIQYFIKSIRNGEFDIIETYIECLSLMDKKEEAFELLEKYKNYVNMNKEIKELFAKCVKLPTN